MRFAPNVGRVAVTIASLGLLVVAGARDETCAETAVQRGAYLVNTIGACSHCRHANECGRRGDYESRHSPAGSASTIRE